MSERISFEVPEALIDAIAARAAAIVLAEVREQHSGGRWLTGAAAAAEYLGCSRRRIYNRLPDIPHTRNGARLIFNTDDLDAWLRSNVR